MLQSEFAMPGKLMTGLLQVLVEPIMIFQSDTCVYYLNDH